jgi:hypothetical protein
MQFGYAPAESKTRHAFRASLYTRLCNIDILLSGSCQSMYWRFLCINKCTESKSPRQASNISSPISSFIVPYLLLVHSCPSLHTLTHQCDTVQLVDKLLLLIVIVVDIKVYFLEKRKNNTTTSTTTKKMMRGYEPFFSLLSPIFLSFFTYNVLHIYTV